MGDENDSNTSETSEASDHPFDAPVTAAAEMGGNMLGATLSVLDDTSGGDSGDNDSGDNSGKGE